MPPFRPLAIRFAQKVNRSGAVVPGMDSPCWEWTASRNEDGYGTIWTGDRNAKAHRVAWMLSHGEIPVGYEVCHHCDNPGCVNPSHLFTAPHVTNIADMKAKGRARRPRGELNPRAKITAADAATIWRRARSGESPRVIASDYPVTGALVRRIRNGLAWAHVTGAARAP